jgi:hypothetical protein
MTFDDAIKHISLTGTKEERVFLAAAFPEKYGSLDPSALKLIPQEQAISPHPKCPNCLHPLIGDLSKLQKHCNKCGLDGCYECFSKKLTVGDKTDFICLCPRCNPEPMTVVDSVVVDEFDEFMRSK